MRNTPRPTTKKQVKSFMGLEGYYRDHIPAFVKISAPLTELIKKGKAEYFQCKEVQERANSSLEEYLLQEPVLTLNEAACTMYRQIQSWGGGCASTGKLRETISDGLHK